MECGGLNMIFEECASCETTCENYRIENSNTGICTADCSPRCVCEPGYHRNTHDPTGPQCIRESDCPCFQMNKAYGNNQTIFNDCNEW